MCDRQQAGLTTTRDERGNMIKLEFFVTTCYKMICIYLLRQTINNCFKIDLQLDLIFFNNIKFAVLQSIESIYKTLFWKQNTQYSKKFNPHSRLRVLRARAVPITPHTKP